MSGKQGDRAQGQVPICKVRLSDGARIPPTKADVRRARAMFRSQDQQQPQQASESKAAEMVPDLQGKEPAPQFSQQKLFELAPSVFQDNRSKEIRALKMELAKMQDALETSELRVQALAKELAVAKRNRTKKGRRPFDPKGLRR